MDVVGSTRTPPRLCLHVTLFLQAILLLASVTSGNRSGEPLGAVEESGPEIGARPGGREDWNPVSGGAEPEALASGPEMSRERIAEEEADTVWKDGFGGEESVKVSECPHRIEEDSSAECQGIQRRRSRPRRSLAFPEGSKASLRVNFKYVLFNTSNWLAYANGFRTAWDLPKNGSVALPFARSIQRREIYRDIEEIMVYHGLDGRSCILRGLCEATESNAAGSGIVGRLLHLLFTVPEEEEHVLEEYSPIESDWKRKEMANPDMSGATGCHSLYSSCPFSLLKMNAANRMRAPFLAVLTALVCLPEPALPEDGSTGNSTGSETYVPSAGRVLASSEVHLDQGPVGRTHVSRRRRYLSFPEGSTLSVVLCLTVSPFMPQNWYTFGMTAGLGFSLPNSTFFTNPENIPSAIGKRRDRRELYIRLEEVMNDRGYDGRSCILRLICEVAAFPETSKGTFIQELLRLIFTSEIPSEHRDLILAREADGHASYDEASQRGRRARALREGKGRRRKKNKDEDVCASHYGKCPHSILDTALTDFAGAWQNVDLRARRS
ncbi:uncharacterized protein LOC124166469 [Ischnura elegans]|uniref:uncharacterized protein LOC124166469 n=1 Tax=Ischnura elegans TaxID=197161 RepID=UPI001ED882ED|nr:uncharacterized protein LOC124166469 [Ischnura elegans]